MNKKLFGFIFAFVFVLASFCLFANNVFAAGISITQSSLELNKQDGKYSLVVNIVTSGISFDSQYDSFKLVTSRGNKDIVTGINFIKDKNVYDVTVNGLEQNAPYSVSAYYYPADHANKYDYWSNMLNIITPSTSPTIANFSPTYGKVGDTITINGTNFAQVYRAYFNGRGASITSISPTQIVVTVPSDATSGPLEISFGTTAGSPNIESSNSFTVTGASNVAGASISGFSPLSGKVGDTITINGENFTGVDKILFGSIDVGVDFKAVSITQITFKVPVGAIDSKITVKTTNGDAVSTETFRITLPIVSVVKITNISPTSGKVGDMITITGTNFVGVNNIYFGTTKAVTTTNIPTEITVKVPVGATSGKITIETTNYGNTVSTNDFTITSTTGAVTSTSTSTAGTNTGINTGNSGTAKFSGLVPVCNTIIDPVTSNYSDPCDFNMVMTLINTVISFLLIDMATPLFALILIYVGWLYLSAGDSSENVTKAKKILKNAVIGYIIALAAFLIVKMILSSLGFVGDSFLG